MPVSVSGVTFEVYSVPNGVGMAWPPANNLPPGAVWHATQSPAWARYSPRATIDALSVAWFWADAEDVHDATATNDPIAIQREPLGNCGPNIVCPSAWFAAARQRHR